MDVMELNGGRFYLRPLHDDERIDDRPALKKLRVNPDDFISMARISLDRYCWAICEQTSVEMVALGVYDHALGDIVTHPIGDPNRVLPNDPVLPPKTVQDAADDGSGGGCGHDAAPRSRRWNLGQQRVRQRNASRQFNHMTRMRWPIPEPSSRPM